MTMWWETDPDLKSTYESFRGRMSERFGGDPEMLADFDASVSLVAGMAAGLAMRNAPAAHLPTDIQQAFTLMFRTGSALRGSATGFGVREWAIVLGADVGRIAALAEGAVLADAKRYDPTDPAWREAIARLGAHSLMAAGAAFHEELGKAIGEEPATPGPS